jgi:hypothetical protein
MGICWKSQQGRTLTELASSHQYAKTNSSKKMARVQKRLAKEKPIVDQGFYTKSFRFAEVEDEHVSSSDADEPDEIGFFRKPSASEYEHYEEQSLSKPRSSGEVTIKPRGSAWMLEEGKQESDEDSPGVSLAKPGKAAKLSKRAAPQLPAEALDQQAADLTSQMVAEKNFRADAPEETKEPTANLERSEFERFADLQPKDQKRRLLDLQRSNRKLTTKIQEAKRELEYAKSVNLSETSELSEKLQRTVRDLQRYRKDSNTAQDRIETCKQLILNKDANVAMASRLTLYKEERAELSETNQALRATAEAKLASDSLALSRYSGNTDKMSTDEIKNFMVGLSETIQQVSFALATCEYRPPNPDMCLVCGERKKDLLFLNCNHLATCQQCGEKATVCCLCMQRVVKTVVVFA